jgi:hypothetical protein
MKTAGKMYLVVAFNIRQRTQEYCLVSADLDVADGYVKEFNSKDYPHAIIRVDVAVSDNEEVKACKRCAGNLYCTCPF